MTKFLKTICLTILLSLSFANLASAKPPVLTKLSIDVKDTTRFNLQKGPNASELILKMRSQPKDLLTQLKNQFNDNFLAYQIINQAANDISIKLIIRPADFRFSYKRRIRPHRIAIEIYPGNLEEGDPGHFPIMPFWEMLSNEEVILPPVQYIPDNADEVAKEKLKEALELMKIGAYEAGETKMETLIKDAAFPLLEEALMIYAEILFRLSSRYPERQAEARKALQVIADKAESKPLKARATLLMGYSNERGKDSEQALATFSKGQKDFDFIGDYFLLGRLHVLIKLNRLKEAQKLTKQLTNLARRDERVARQLCFLKAIILAREAKVAYANKLADTCVEAMGGLQHVGVEALIPLAEIRNLQHRFGDAKQALAAIIREYPDHPKTSIAALRLGDVYYNERKYKEAITAYTNATQRWPQSPSGMLAALKTDMMLHRIARDKAAIIFARLDVHGQVPFVSREAKLAVIWQHYEDERWAGAYRYLVDFIRYEDGGDLWAFAPKKLQEIVMNHYRSMYEKEENYELLNTYTSNTQLPLTSEQKDEIAHLVAKTYMRIGYPEEASKVYIDALGRGDRKKTGERELLLGLTETYIAAEDAYRAGKTMEYYEEHYTGKEDRKLFHKMMGRINKTKGDLDKALSEYEKAIALSESNVEKRRIALEIGMEFYRREEFEKSAKLLNLAIGAFVEENLVIDAKKITKQVRNAFFFLGDSYFQTKNHQKAYDVYMRAARLFPEDKRAAIAKFFASESAVKLGKKEAAESLWQELAADKDPYWKKIGNLKIETSEWFEKHDIDPAKLDLE